MSVTRMHGTIKLFKQEYMWGIILGDDSIDYQFNEANIADSALLETLKNTQANNYRGISVSFKPGKYQNRSGENRDIAVGITASNSLIPSSIADSSVTPFDSSDDQAPSIPPEIKSLVYQILWQEQERKGRILRLAEMVPLLKTHDVLIGEYGYKKAKAFLCDLEFADALPLGINGADCIVLNKELAEAFLSTASEAAGAPLVSKDNNSHIATSSAQENAVCETNLKPEDCATDTTGTKDSEAKELLSIEAQIAFMESRGVRFDRMKKDEAEYYLSRRTNYFRIRAFREGFQKFVHGKSAGKYINLDFAWLVDLVEIDDSLRAIMRNMTSDVEQAARMIILEEVEAHESEPFGIVQEFLRSEHGAKTRRSLNTKHELLNKNELDPFVAGLVRRYGESNQYPIWAFLELITFGSLCWFYGFASDRYESEKPHSCKILDQDRHIFQVVKLLRNACAHGNCILNNLSTAGNGSSEDRCIVNWDVKAYVKGIDGISDAELQRFLYDKRIYSLVTTLYAHQQYVEEEPYQRACKQLAQLADRMETYRNVCADGNNDAVFFAFSFLEKVIRATHGTHKH